MDISCIRYFEIDGKMIPPEMVSSYSLWPRLGGLCALLRSRNMWAIVTDRKSGSYIQHEYCTITYISKVINDQNIFIALGFCPVFNQSLHNEAKAQEVVGEAYFKKEAPSEIRRT